MSESKNICLFSSYFKGDSLPYYVRVYVKELRKHIQEVVLVNAGELDKESSGFLLENNIQFQTVSNEGFDFGAWYKVFQKIDTSLYDQVFLVNDSCVLFRSLDPFMNWAEKNSADVKGMTFSEAVTPHIQSYFMVLNKKAIALTTNYFKKHGIKKSMSEVISTYELGLNQLFVNNGLSLASFVDNNGYKGEFSPYYKCVDHHLQKGIPLIKKKILFASYRPDELSNLARMGLNIRVDHYYDQMKQKSDLIIDVDKLKQENPPQMNSSQLSSFEFKSKLIKLFRPIYKAFRK